MKQLMNTALWLLLLFSAQLAASQSIEISGISANDFYGFNTMKGYGYFLYYKKAGKQTVELYDQDLNLTHKAELKMKVNEASAKFSGLHNGASFLVFNKHIYGFGKTKCVVTAFDAEFKQTAQMEVDGNFVDAYVIDEGHYGFLSNKGSKNSLDILDNRLKLVSSTPFGDSYRLMPQLYASQPDLSVTSAMKGTELPTDGEPLFFTIGVDTKLLKYVGCKVFAFDKNGKMRFEYSIDPQQMLPYCGYVRHGKVYVVVREGEMPDNMLDTTSHRLATLVLDQDGKLLQKIQHEIVTNNFLESPLNILVEEDGVVITRGVDTHDGSYDPMSVEAINGMMYPSGSTQLEFLYFDKDANYLGSQQFTSLEKGEGREGYNFFHTSQLADEEVVYAVFSQLGKEGLHIYASDGTSKMKLLHTAPWSGTSIDNFYKGRISVHPAGPGKFVAGVYDVQRMTFTGFKKSIVLKK